MSKEQIQALESLQELSKNIEEVIGHDLPLDLKQVLNEIHNYILRKR